MEEKINDDDVKFLLDRFHKMPRLQPKFRLAVVTSRCPGSVINSNYNVSYLTKRGGPESGMMYQQEGPTPNIVSIPGYAIMGKVTCLIDRSQKDDSGRHPYVVLWLNEFAVFSETKEYEKVKPCKK